MLLLMGTEPAMTTLLDADQPAGVDGPVDNMQRVYEEVRRAILNGELTPGMWVSQVRLAARLKVSRTPLREALRRLQTEGLVNIDFNHRMRVAPLSVDDLESLYAIRIVTEPLAVRLSLPRLTDAALDDIGASLRALNTAVDIGDEEASLEAHRAFHFGLFAAAQDRIRNNAENLWDHSVRYVTMYHPDPHFRQSLVLAGREGHQRIYDAAARRADGQASRLVAEHLAKTALMVLANVAGDHEPVPVREALRFVLTAAADA
jgi:DNA-binding GntR family transcriptional regulator